MTHKLTRPQLEDVLSPRWPCGHQRTPENTASPPQRRDCCRTCRSAKRRESARRYRDSVSPAEKHFDNRLRYIPTQIRGLREKLARVEAEARALGLNPENL